MKKQTTKKRVKKPTQLDRIESALKILTSAQAVKTYEEMAEAKESAAKEPQAVKPK